MTEKEKEQQPTPPPRAGQAIALPPLKMVLVHAVDARKAADARLGRREEPVDTRALKRLISHLEQK